MKKVLKIKKKKKKEEETETISAFPITLCETGSAGSFCFWRGYVSGVGHLGITTV